MDARSTYCMVMISDVKAVFTNWRESFFFKSLPISQKGIVFYSEAKASSPHLGPLIRELVSRGRSIQLLVSDPEDPLIELVDVKANIHRIGTGLARTWTFSNLESAMLVTTTPDLQKVQLKRSKFDVFYVYAHHSMNSTHMAYRQGAFDYFDAILCTGPQQIHEIRTNEELQGLPRKTLVEQGYCRLDSLRNNVSKLSLQFPKDFKDSQITVLVAPTWGDSSILSICGNKVIELLLAGNFNVILRPHSETLRKSPEVVRSLSEQFGRHKKFTVDTNPNSELSMHNSDIMISDWSGVATEYAYSFEKPVLFIDLPRKVNNPGYENLGIEPSEVSVRTEIGEIIGVKDLSRISEIISRLVSQGSNQIAQIRCSRAKRVFNIDTSAEVGATYIENIADMSGYKERAEYQQPGR